MKVRPMLGQYQLEGIESIGAAQRRTLVEHRVPGMEGSYLQDLGSAPNAIVIAGTRTGDDARDAFLEEVRTLFGTGEPTTFAADINTATDLTDVVIEDLHVAEVAGEPDAFRYVLRLRKYVEPPAPAAAGLGGLDAGLLDQAASLVEVLDTLDALASAPNLGDPTPPLRAALDGVRTASSAVAPAAAGAESSLGPVAERGRSLPAPSGLTGALTSVQGDGDSSGLGGALGALTRADVPGQGAALVASLDGMLATALPAQGATPGASAVEQVGGAAASLPAPDGLAAPLAAPLSQIGRLTGPEAAGAIPAAVASLTQLTEQTADPAALLAGAATLLHRFDESAGSLGGLTAWSEGVATLASTLAAPTPDVVITQLVALLGQRATDLAASLLPGGGPAAALSSALGAAGSASRTAGVRASADALATALERIGADAAGGSVPSGESLAAAEAALGAVSTQTAGLTAALDDALHRPGATADGLAAELTRVHAGLRDIEIVDAGDPRAVVGDAFEALREAIGTLDLAAAIAPVRDTLTAVAAAVAQLDLGRLAGALDSAQGAAQEALGRLDGALLEVLALSRAAFNAVRDALRAATSALGAPGDDGRFRFHAEAEVDALLTRVRDGVRDDLGPALTTFRTTIDTTVGEVSTALDGVTAQIDAAKAQIQTALETATAELEAVDITATVRELGEQLAAAVDGLGAIDLDAVVDPVVAQIGEMRDALRRIDPGTLNDILRAALGAASAALSAIDFPKDITAVLERELDELLAEPAAALAGLQERFQEALGGFAALDPAALAAPLAGLFEPVARVIDEISVDAVAAPLHEWYASAAGALDAVMPERLLAPLVDAHAQLASVVASVSADALFDVLERARGTVLNELARLEPATLANGLNDEVGRVRALVAALGPATVLAPVVAAFDRVAARLAGLAPAQLLAPLGSLAGMLAQPLAALTDEHARLAAQALAPLRAAVDGCDPAAAFAAAAGSTAEVAQRLAGIDLETVLAAARTRHGAAVSALRALGDPAAAALARVQALSPLDDAALTRAIADLRRIRDALATAFPGPAAPAALTASFDAVRPVVTALVPEWARATPTADGLRGAFAWVDPSAIAGGLDAVHGEVVAQWAALDPRAAIAPLDELHAQVASALEAIDPQAIAARVQALVGGVAESLAALDLDAVRNDGRAVQDEVAQLVAGLDPAPTIERLSALASDVRGLVAQLDPAALLAGLDGPVAAVRGIVGAVDPAAIVAALEPAFQRIRELLAQLDITAALAPFTDRVDALRDELVAALRRTESAFRELLAAIPS